MAKNDTTAPAEAETPVVNPITVSLNEFCIRLSETVTRPELIGAFEFSERTAGNARGTTEEYKARYTAFINKPV